MKKKKRSCVKSLQQQQSLSSIKKRELVFTKLDLFAIIKNCQIKMESISNIRSESLENYDILKDFNVNPRLKFLRLLDNSLIKNETLVLFASIFPNLLFLDLSLCLNISKRGICQVLNRCSKLRHLNLAHGYSVKGLKMNIALHQLEMLDLSDTSVDDKTLFEISKSCFGLLKLLLIFCDYVTEKRVMHLTKNDKQLKEIYLTDCAKVNVDVVVSILSSRASLRVFSSKSEG